MTWIISLSILLWPGGVLFADTVSNEQLQMISERNEGVVKRKIDYAWKKDPFFKQPGFVAGGELPVQFDLKSIIYAGDESIASINGQEVYFNSVIEGYRVAEIGTNFVLLEKGDSIVELQLPPIRNESTASVVESENADNF